MANSSLKYPPLPSGFQIEGEQNIPALPKGFVLESEAPKESFGKKATRAALQPALGALEGTRLGIATSIWEKLAEGESLAELEELEERLPELREKFPGFNIPEKIDREKYMQAVEAASSTVPNVSNISRFVEEMTGLPLSPQTELDRSLRMLGAAARLGKGTPAQRIHTGLKAESARQALLSSGVPESASDLLSIAYALLEKTPVAKKKAAIKVKPSAEAGAPPPGAPPPGAPPPGAPPPGPFPGKGEKIPVSETTFDIAEKSLKELQKPIEIKEKTSAISLPKEEGKPLTGRTKILNQEVENIVSPKKFYNEKQGGIELSGKIKQEAKSERKPFEKKYKIADKSLEKGSDIFPSLVKENEKLIENLEKTASRNPGEEAVYKKLLSLKDLLGSSEGYIEVPLSRLVKTADSLSGLANYEMPYTGPKNLLKKLVKDINEAVIASGKKQGLNVQALIDADKLYSQWANKYLNDELAPFLEKTIRNPEALTRKAISDEGIYRALRDALGKKNQIYSKKLEREIVGNRLNKYIRNPKLVNNESFLKDMANLEGLIGKESTNKIKEKLIKQSKIPSPEVTPEQVAKKKIAPERVKLVSGKKASEYLDKSIESIENSLNSREGIRKLRKDLSDINQSKIFDDLVKQKTEEIFREGLIETPKLTGDNLYKIIAKEKNYRLLEEMYGKEAVNAALNDARKAAKQEFTRDKLIKLTKIAGSIAGASKLIKVLGLFL